MEESTDTPLWRFSTMKLGGEARRLCQPQSADELIGLIEQLKRNSEPWFILGGGSNTLVSSEGVNGTVIRMTQMTRLATPEPELLIADAGARLPHLAKYAAGLGLSGLEFAVGIPGTVGGAVVMNAGAHGSCMANVVESATVLDCRSGKITEMNNADLQFVYRNSAIDPNTQVVLSARLRLKPGPEEEIKKITQHNEEYRWRTQPLGWPNLGSTFKNPSADKSAGLLLDQSGAKQFKEGNAAVSAIHANFVINLGGASSTEVLRLLRRMQEVVFEKHGLHLHPEWKTLGNFSENLADIWNGES
ncbi:MAG: UDP-N-acetylmuramate dehydrogenase [Candidatus Obscuribacterales bacterium]|nr:UDP-N-acetylmuramate dehydrogenase [Candidatus Obscuribacterales bacterium]